MNDRKQRRRSSDHAIEPQRLRNRPLLVRRALRLLRILGLRLVVAFALYDAVFLLHPRDVQRRNRQAAVFPGLRSRQQGVRAPDSRPYAIFRLSMTSCRLIAPGEGSDGLISIRNV